MEGLEGINRTGLGRMLNQRVCRRFRRVEKHSKFVNGLEEFEEQLLMLNFI